MKTSELKIKPRGCALPVQSVVDFISQCRGLSFLESESEELTICQRADGKCLTFKTSDIEKVLYRVDVQKKPFLQVNFKNNKKFLLTDDLIGFKPIISCKQDESRLPKVVTTPDLLSFIEILENSIGEHTISSPQEIEDVRRYFDCVLKGAENIGFNLTCERIWIERLLNHQITQFPV